MKIAVTASGPELTSPVDQRFGRARYVVFVDLPERTLQAVENRGGVNAAQGAGVQTAQTVIDGKAEAVISGHCGPKAFRALAAAGIRVYLTPPGSVAEALDRFERGELNEASGADVDGHW